MSDLISRQAAIDVVKGIDTHFVKYIQQLPPAQPEPCEDAVSRLEIIRNLHKYFKEGFEQDKWWNSGHVIHAIMDAPSVTPKQRTGKWIRLDMHAHLADHKCTACEQECYVPTCMGEPMYAFCPNCGADMRGEGVKE